MVTFNFCSHIDLKTCRFYQRRRPLAIENLHGIYLLMIEFHKETASRLTGIEKSAFVVYLREATPQDVGVGGELLEDVIRTRQH
ncbi:MAG: hypothetical protein AMJ73_07740 [candidate division Zixibacteria bacterium SM1_73]|nr:MAG: hypothetical protein AMJ73_07740 [candidate division Zixibacteria bacterium SM1_73]